MINADLELFYLKLTISVQHVFVIFRFCGYYVSYCGRSFHIVSENSNCLCISANKRLAGAEPVHYSYWICDETIIRKNAGTECKVVTVSYGR